MNQLSTATKLTDGAPFTSTLETDGHLFDFLNPNNWHQEKIGKYGISLSNRVDVTAWVSPEDWKWARQWLWCHTFGSGRMVLGAIQHPDHIYARRSIRIPGRVTPSGRPAYGNCWLHREICKRAHGPAPSLFHVADHLDGDTLNNQRHNLRWATLSENASNVHGIAWRQMRLQFQLARLRSVKWVV
jgi:hypothetical protein